MAGESAEVEAGLSSEFDERRAKWAAEQNPAGEAGHFALDRVISATFRIERCERAIDEITADIQERAGLAWDQDRAVEAARVAARLGKDPVLASRQLQTSLAGVTLLIEAWYGLAAALLSGGDWSESEASRALDLLGVAPDLRSGRTVIHGPEGSDHAAFRRELVKEEIERLEELRDDSLAPLDEMDRRRAMAGHLALLSKPAKLVLRYGCRAGLERYWESMKEVKASALIALAGRRPGPGAGRAPRASGGRGGRAGGSLDRAGGSEGVGGRESDSLDGPCRRFRLARRARAQGGRRVFAPGIVRADRPRESGLR